MNCMQSMQLCCMLELGPVQIRPTDWPNVQSHHAGLGCYGCHMQCMPPTDFAHRAQSAPQTSFMYSILHAGQKPACVLMVHGAGAGMGTVSSTWASAGHGTALALGWPCVLDPACEATLRA